MRVEGTRLRTPRGCCARSCSTLVGTDLRPPVAAGAAHDGLPGVVMVVGVNGAGKTTTVGKLARVLVADGATVRARRRRHLPRRRRRSAADLGRAGRRRAPCAARRARDPASVAFEAVKQGIERRASTPS